MSQAFIKEWQAVQMQLSITDEALNSYVVTQLLEHFYWPW